MKHVTPREGPGNQAPAGQADTKARRRRRTARQAGSAGVAKPTTTPSSPPEILADFHPTLEQQAGARKWLVRVLAQRAVERLKEHDRKP